MTPFERPEDFARAQMMRPEVSLPLTDGYVRMLEGVIAARDAYLLARIAAALEPAGPDDAAHDPIARVREVLREAGWREEATVEPTFAPPTGWTTPPGWWPGDAEALAMIEAAAPLVVTGPATTRADVAPMQSISPRGGSPVCDPLAPQDPVIAYLRGLDTKGGDRGR